MAITLTCPRCRKSLRAHEEDVGRQVFCPHCMAIVAVPTGGPPLAEAAPAPDGLQPDPGRFVPPSSWHVKPHRGTAILVLGILSWAVCAICGIVAWVMGNADLKEMAAGRMDPSGLGLTQAGRTLGMVHVIFFCCVIGAMLLFLLLVAAAGH